ncbi:MAG: hypothetical protein A3B34_01080 [Candidatus Sungbacteria bacterium RIFCSPLOWO2_01_FULL_54_21]|uniref:Uncharacterized protein n=2 Tax=Candidatus Sungiibacteriota TaxID=1817917 RepID=A0A1G2L7A5_9BACT|nr:MAG: hypothetical protein A2679_01205 [Candidatus Sungbacteria bacterium RIFCSPHIGHO2_01_FULL_54_26]OHA03797.1 MAG: hypothetical protein A3C92_03950 [Candidatus Sungbacteria bacterium RIFCSPHIGHO2_02_FULL_53_17]OHA07528.1 MAG: hypothetical protein A3B34_01080 [Candidatus Sungbacteria bacterium RIFCSPLOWO2_01_FULL_54_21]
MKKTFKIPTIVLVVLTPAAAFAQDTITGLEFLGLKADAKIGDIIAQIYIFGVGFVALSALIIFTIGGVMYIFAGDKDPGKAKEMMRNAFWGLVLALTSWLILYTINPELVKNIGNLKLQTIQTSTDSQSATGTAAQGAICVLQLNAPITQTCASPLRCVVENIGRNCFEAPTGTSQLTTCQKAERMCDAPAPPPVQGTFRCRLSGSDTCVVGSAFNNSTCGNTCPGLCVSVSSAESTICNR